MNPQEHVGKEASFDDLLDEALEGVLDDPGVRAVLMVRAKERIKEILGGERRYIPLPSHESRNDRIWIDYCGGTSVRDLAWRYGLSDKRIYQIIGERKDDLE